MLNPLFKSITLTTTLLALLWTPVSYGADSINHASQSVKHSALGAKHLASGTVKVAASVVALPLLSTGGISLKAGESLIKFAIPNKEADDAYDDNTPLPIADEVVIAGPSPKNLLASQDDQQ
ncbi:MAG: hypothetical protein ACI8WB_005157 [Phenylobacterium sp.]|jgi:hypothetical protein